MSKGINPNLKLKARTLRPLDEYLDGLKSGDRYILSEVLTLVESTNSTQRSLGEQILKTLDPSDYNHTVRIGITGSPGSGKSTFIEALGKMLVDGGKKVAVLAVDPSSTRSQGSILGDKTRMSELSTHPSAFVRPTASANILGGVARATKESISLCEAAGYDIVIIESVGVGQSETVLSDLVDVYLLILLPGGGDGVQGIKRGVVELADILIINKNDGDRKTIAKQSQIDFKGSIRLFHHELQGWKVPVDLCSAIENEGIESIWNSIQEYNKTSKDIGHFSDNRSRQDIKWVAVQIQNEILRKASELYNAEQYLTTGDKEIKQSVFKILQNAKEKIEADHLKFLERKNSIEE